MKHTNKLLLLTSAIALTTALTAGSAFAQEFDDFGGFDDSDNFGADSFSDGGPSSSSKFEVSGTLSTDVRAYVDTSATDDASASDVEMEATPAGSLNLGYSGNKSDLELSLNLNTDTIKNHPEDVIDELVLRGRFGDYFTFEAGKMRVVWGKGDKLHVLDNFNSDDYSDFIIPDYLDRRISTPMVRGILSLPFANLNLEGVYTPFLPVDRFATDGRWTPAQVSALTSKVTNSATTKVATAFENYTTATATVGGAGASYEISKESAAKAKTALETATSAFNQANAIYSELNTKYNAILSGYEQAKTAYPSITWDYYLTNIANVTPEQFESLRKGYSEAAAAYYAATGAKATAQTTYDGYASAETQALAAYNQAKADAKTAGEAYMLALTYANALSADPTVIYPELYNLKYSQFGGRATWSMFGLVDMGLSYYNGWYKQPSFNESKLDSFVTSYLATGSVNEDEKFLAYDKKQTFGLEASSIIWHFNVRGEFAYNLTDDTDGTNPWVHNNSIAWLGGFDIDLPFWDANLNVQETGTYILHNDECDKNPLDVDHAVNAYSNNKIVANFTTSFMNGKIAPEVTAMYGIENGDLVVMPKLAFKPDQNLTLTASGMYIWCKDDNSEFAAWKNNSFVNLGATYQF